MSARAVGRMPGQWLARLAGQDDGLDFGIYRRLRVLRGELERLLTEEFPATVGSTLAPADWPLVYESLQRLIECWQHQGIECRPARQRDTGTSASAAAAATDHVHATGPLPFYAFRLPSDRRVVFHLCPAPVSALDHDPARLRFVLSQRPGSRPIRVVARELSIKLELAAADSRSKQTVVNAELCHTVASDKAARGWRDELLAPHPSGKARRAQLQYHLDRFTSWPDDDLLLPRDLQPRLQTDLARLVAEELWSPAAIADLDAAGLEVRRRQASLVWDLGERIIAWLDRRNGLWTGLWRQPPRVGRTDYLCTLDRLPQSLRDRVLANDAQWTRWNAWFGIAASSRRQRLEVLGDTPHLVVDTAFYQPEFADELLSAPANAGRPVDGVLIHGENSAALRLLAGRYAGQVTLCAIDPPYNTGIGVWSYSDTRTHAAWLRMMEDRLLLAKDLLADRGALFVMLDDHEQAQLKLLLERVFGEENFLATIVWEKVHTRKNSARHFSVSHDYIHGFARDKRRWRRQLLPRAGSPAYTNHDDDPRGPWKPDPVYANKPYQARYQIAKPNGVLLDPPPGRYWRYSEQALREKAARQELMWGEGAAYPLVKRYLADAQPGLVPVTLFSRQFAGDNAEASAELRALFGRTAMATYPKPSRLFYRLAQIGTTAKTDEIVLDFFAGTGSAAQGVLALNRADGGHRRWILVEKDACFDAVLLPRVAKCIYSDAWKHGQPTGRGTSQLVEVIRLEPLEAAICRE